MQPLEQLIELVNCVEDLELRSEILLALAGMLNALLDEEEDTSEVWIKVH